MHSTPLNSRSGVLARLWGPTWRTALVAILGIIIFAVFWGVTDEELQAAGGSLDDVAPLVLIDLVLGVAAVVLYPLRHRWPMLVVSLIVALSTLSAFAGPAALFAVVSLATRRRTVEITVISCLLLFSLYVNTLINPIDDSEPLWLLAVAAGVVVVIPILLGMYIGARRQSLQALQERAEQLQREQDARLETARLGERSRIARDMHDSLAHRLSLVSLHAGALEYRTDLSPEEARNTASVVRENARLAASHLREVLGLLREPAHPDESSIVRPDPSALESINPLLADSRDAGNPATLDMTSTVANHIEELPTTLRQHANRIIQEGLTNARKHAPGSAVTVRIDGAPGQRLMLSLSNPILAASHPTEPASSGFGLMGLRERARIAGGDLRTDVVEGTFVMDAWFPWKA